MCPPAAGLPIDTATATTVTATGYSGNKITKSGGLVGLAVHLHDARRRELDVTRTIAAYVLVTMSGAVGALAVVALVFASRGLPSFAATALGVALVLSCAPWIVRRQRFVARGVRWPAAATISCGSRSTPSPGSCSAR
jgi:hypothetical protein